MFKKLDDNNIEVTTTTKKVVSKEKLLDRLQHVNSAISQYEVEKIELQEQLDLLGEI